MVLVVGMTTALPYGPFKAPGVRYSHFRKTSQATAWVCCVALPCCLFDLACFFLPSFSSLIKTFTCVLYIYIHVSM